MARLLLYDSSYSVPPDIGNMLGVRRFSDVYYRKRSMMRWVSDICEAAGIQFVDIGSGNGALGTIKHHGIVRAQDLVVMYLPAFIAFRCPEEDAALFLRKLSLTRTSLRVSEDPTATRPESLQVAVLVGELAQAVLQAVSMGESVGRMLADAMKQLHPIKGDVSMIDMRDPLSFTDYLTSNFDARYFNSIQPISDCVLLKRSSDVDKLQREYKYYNLLPAALQMFFIQPYDFKLENGYASYKMERLFVPDMALQWIHGSLDELNFKRLLDKVFYYISARPVRRVSMDAARAVHLNTYRHKVTARLEQLKVKPEYAKLRPYLDANFGGIDALFEMYFKLLDQTGERAISRDLRLGHGDLCFSNILYSKTTDLMRFIDPRGADSDDDLYVSPYYDLAKLSHSIVGNYDFINYGLYRLDLNSDLQLKLETESTARSWAREMFEARLREAGFDPALIRLFETSLFLSMVPLHIDSPQKVLAFLVNASQILSEVERLL